MNYNLHLLTYLQMIKWDNSPRKVHATANPQWMESQSVYSFKEPSSKQSITANPARGISRPIRRELIVKFKANTKLGARNCTHDKTGKTLGRFRWSLSGFLKVSGKWKCCMADLIFGSEASGCCRACINSGFLKVSGKCNCCMADLIFGSQAPCRGSPYGAISTSQ